MENKEREKLYWNAYLLNLPEVLKIREEGKLLRAMKHEDIVKLKVWGPIEVEALDSYAARKTFYSLLEQEKWFRAPQGGFTTTLPAIYVKNKVDRRVKQGVPLDILLRKAKQAARA